MKLFPLILILLSFSLSAQKKPNILFIFTDDHAYQAVGAYDSWLKSTAPPRISIPLPEMVCFSNSAMSQTRFADRCGQPFKPGKYSHANGFLVNGNKFDGTQQTFPKLLRKAGYTTAVVGKWHLGTHMSPQGYDYSEVLIGQGPYYNPPMRLDKDGDGKHDEVIKHVGYTTDIITDLALDWMINKRDKEKPFMLMYQHKAPHRNWQPGPKYLNKYDDVTLPEPDTLFDNYKGRTLAAYQQDMTIAETMNRGDLKLDTPGNLTPEQKKLWNAAYHPKNQALRKQT